MVFMIMLVMVMMYLFFVFFSKLLVNLTWDVGPFLIGIVSNINVFVDDLIRILQIWYDLT